MLQRIDLCALAVFLLAFVTNLILEASSPSEIEAENSVEAWNSPMHKVRNGTWT